MTTTELFNGIIQLSTTVSSGQMIQHGLKQNTLVECEV